LTSRFLLRLTDYTEFCSSLVYRVGFILSSKYLGKYLQYSYSFGIGNIKKLLFSFFITQESKCVVALNYFPFHTSASQIKVPSSTLT